MVIVFLPQVYSMLKKPIIITSLSKTVYVWNRHHLR
ncbi:hypothetical protein BIFADO_01546 [Bifidobacterium adolescentis L2-32]|uniref:Uncharacterized protein n=1 Tax=Bifidobacterium adolescentis L2-32 TaxID=411481 RepID=A7A6R3_BIFAD|nr:hypothetical protein BIFADO_01546 [Bifidobacterium adolescentis L2-32]